MKAKYYSTQYSIDIFSDPTMAVTIRDIVKEVWIESGRPESNLMGGRFSH